MPREYQDYSFVVTQVAGRRLKRLVGAVIVEASDTAPCVVFAQLDEPQEWHRFFLQARIAFWEIWDDQKIEEEMDDFNGDDVRLVDYAQLIGGLPMRIETAAAYADAEDLTHIKLLFENGRSMTLTPDSPDMESNFHIIVS